MRYSPRHLGVIVAARNPVDGLERRDRTGVLRRVAAHTLRSRTRLMTSGEAGTATFQLAVGLLAAKAQLFRDDDVWAVAKRLRPIIAAALDPSAQPPGWVPTGEDWDADFVESLIEGMRIAIRGIKFGGRPERIRVWHAEDGTWVRELGRRGRPDG